MKYVCYFIHLTDEVMLNGVFGSYVSWQPSFSDHLDILDQVVSPAIYKLHDPNHKRGTCVMALLRSQHNKSNSWETYGSITAFVQDTMDQAYPFLFIPFSFITAFTMYFWYNPVFSTHDEIQLGKKEDHLHYKT